MNNQTDIWSGEFGVRYARRNRYNPGGLDEAYLTAYGVTRTAMNLEFLSDLPKDSKILEVGCNVGNQLELLQKMGFANLYGVDVNICALEKAEDCLPKMTFLQADAKGLPFLDNYFDLVFTSGVLIHIPPIVLDKVISEMFRCSKKYVWGFEYYSDTIREVEYQGRTEMLWKQDFKLMHEPYGKLIKEVKYKYLQNDNIDSMYLFEKGAIAK